MKARILTAAVLLLLLLAIAVPARAQTASPQQTLNQYVADLQNNPNDSALRQKIIALVLTMRSAPVIPEEARRHYVKACTLSEDAKQPSDFADAAEEFRHALLIAPWWGDAYRKMGRALEEAQHYDNAIASLKLFMATKPQDDVLRNAQDEIYRIEAKAEKKAAKDKELAEAKARESSPEAIAARKQAEFDAFLAKIDGRRYTYEFGRGQGKTVLDVRGRFLVMGNIDVNDIGGVQRGYVKWRGFPGPNPVAIQGFETVVPLDPSTVSIHPVEATFIIGADGSSITRHTRLNTGVTDDTVFLWER